MEVIVLFDNESTSPDLRRRFTDFSSWKVRVAIRVAAHRDPHKVWIHGGFERFNHPLRLLKVMELMVLSGTQSHGIGSQGE